MSSSLSSITCASCHRDLLDITGLEPCGPYVTCCICNEPEQRGNGETSITRTGNKRSKTITPPHHKRPMSLCLLCLFQGKEPEQHIKTHPYVVVKPLEQIKIGGDSDTWTASQDFALLWGIETYGYGNWDDIANKAMRGNKTIEECKTRFELHRVGVDEEPLSVPDMKDTDEELKRAAAVALQTQPYSGYMPLRREFEIVYANDAEQLLADMTFEENEDDSFHELKLKVLRNYNLKLEEREFRKNFMIERQLLDSKFLLAAKSQVNAPDKALLSKLEPLVRFCEKDEFETLVQGLVREQNIREEIRRLEELRSFGVRTMVDADEFFKATRRRETSVVGSAAPTSSIIPILPGAPPPTSGDGTQVAQLALRELNLTTMEREFCEKLNISQVEYVVIKDALVRECLKRGGQLTKSQAQGVAAVFIDVAKKAAVFDFLVHCEFF